MAELRDATSQHDVPAPDIGEREVALIREHYAKLGAKAAVFLDKDKTVVDSLNGFVPTEEGLPEVIEEAQRRGIIVSYDSDSSMFDLAESGPQFQMAGLHVSELGGVIGLPTGEEVHLVQSGPWFSELLARVEKRILETPTMRQRTAMYHGDPYPLIHGDTRFPGPRDRLVLFNRGRVVTGSALFRTLDQSQGGKIISKTPESIAYYEQMRDLMAAERDALLQERPFPDAEGIRDDFNEELELVIMSSRAATKANGMRKMASILQMPIYHIGDGVWDDTSSVPEITTMTVSNGVFKDKPGVIVASKPMTGGVKELFQEHIFPQFPPRAA